MPTPSPKSAASRFESSTGDQATTAAQAKPFADSKGNSTTITYVHALVQLRGQTSTTVDVPEWEIEVLQAIHGAESIKTLSTHEEEYEGTAAEAYQYLKNKYGAREQDNPVTETYPKLKMFAKDTGLPYKVGDEGVSTHQGSLVIHRNKADSSATKQGAAGSGAGGSAAA